MLIIDFETRSRCDLFKRGSHAYARDESTDILCCAFTMKDPSDDRAWLVYPKTEEFPFELRRVLQDVELVAAHNAAFDRDIWSEVAVKKYGWPAIDFDRWYCTSAQCRVNNLPAALDDAAKALDTRHKKNPRGKALIRQLSMPQDDGTFNEDPKLLREMGQYCLDDVRTTKDLVNATRPMTHNEHQDWLFSEDINERGVMVDTYLAEMAQQYASVEYDAISKRLNDWSGGVITKHTQTVRAAGWIVEQLGEDHQAIDAMIKYKDGGKKYSIDKNARNDILDSVELGTYELPAHVLEVIVALHESSMSSVTKFKNMAQRADPQTQRVYGAFVYAGASQTLRFASRGLQLHNFPSRGAFKDIDEAWEVYDIMRAGAELPHGMDSLKHMLRHAIMPAEGKWLVVGDWTGIEARVLPWLANSKGGTEKLDKIASGIDVYREAADAIGQHSRQVGKVVELACGYEGGVGAFKQFARGYGVVMEEDAIRAAIKAWRKLNSWVVQFWRELEMAAYSAVRDPNQMYCAGRVKYYFTPDLMGGSLLCILPNDSVITFPKARLERTEDERSWELTALHASVKMKADDKEWPRASLYGGRLAGIATQGTAGALLRDLIAVCNADVIAHVHDEVILEVDEDVADLVAVDLKQVMETTPDWAKGLPLNAEPEVLERYKK